MRDPEVFLAFLPMISAVISGIGVVATVFIANKFELSELNAFLGLILSVCLAVGIAYIIARRVVSNTLKNYQSFS